MKVKSKKVKYQIKKNGVVVLQVRGTYDFARQEARKMIRKEPGVRNLARYSTYGWFDSTSRNPAKLGQYEIVRA